MLNLLRSIQTVTFYFFMGLRNGKLHFTLQKQSVTRTDGRTNIKFWGPSRQKTSLRQIRIDNLIICSLSSTKYLLRLTLWMRYVNSTDRGVHFHKDALLQVDLDDGLCVGVSELLCCLPWLSKTGTVNLHRPDSWDVYSVICDVTLLLRNATEVWESLQHPNRRQRLFTTFQISDITDVYILQMNHHHVARVWFKTIWMH